MIAAGSTQSPTDGGKLTTHVLDTANGRPAAGLRIDLYRLDGDIRRRLASVRTNIDGRCDAPLLAGDAMVPGTYLLIFHVGTYFSGKAGTGHGGKPPEPGFLDKVPAKQVQNWETQFLKYMHEQRRAVVDALKKERNLTDYLQKKLIEAATAFNAQFKAG